MGCGILFLFQAFFFVSVLWTIYLQHYIGFTAFQTGLISIPFGGLIILSAIYSGKAYDKYGINKPLRLGLMITLVGFLQMLFLLPHYRLWSLLFADACSSAAAFYITSPIRTYAIQRAGVENKGLTNAFLSWCRQIGGTLGLAILTLVQNLGLQFAKSKHYSEKQAYFHGFYWAMVTVTLFVLFAFMLSFLLKEKRG